MSKSERMPNAQTVPVEEAARILGIGRSLAYEAARTGELPVIKIGHRLLVPTGLLEEMLRKPQRQDP